MIVFLFTVIIIGVCAIVSTISSSTCRKCSCGLGTIEMREHKL